MKRKDIVTKIYSGDTCPEYIKTGDGMINQDQLNELTVIALSRVTDFVTFEKQIVRKDNGQELDSMAMILKEPDQLTGEHLTAIARINTTEKGLEIVLHDKLKALDTLSRFFSSLLGDK